MFVEANPCPFHFPLIFPEIPGSKNKKRSSEQNREKHVQVLRSVVTKLERISFYCSDEWLAVWRSGEKWAFQLCSLGTL